MVVAQRLVIDQTHSTLIHFKEDIKLTSKFEYQPKEKGYLGKCPEIDAVVWAETLWEAREELVDAVIDISKVLLENSTTKDYNYDPRLKYAKIINSCTTKEEIRELLGL